jgi:hypothetical protein
MERFGAVTAMDTRVGWLVDGEPEQLDSKTRAQTQTKAALHLGLQARDLAILKILQRT